MSAGEYVLLRDGGQVLIRPYAPADRPAVAALLQRLSAESLRLRFHARGVRVDERTLEFATAGHAVVAEIGERAVALASYARLRDPRRAEMAVLVDDAEQGRGIGTVVFERLARDARREGIESFVAQVLAANQRMLELVHNLGFRTTRTWEQGEVEFELDLRPRPEYVAQADARHHVAAVASLEPLFRPRAVAVVGASRQRGAIGHELFRKLLAGGFAGAIYPVNPAAGAVASVHAYPSVAAIPEPIDLAVIAVPAPAVVAAVESCLDAGVRALVVISAGFAEVGGEGRAWQEALLRLCRARGARMVGPNSLGLLVNAPAGALNATFAPGLPAPGNLAVASQSGAVGIAILEHARERGIGVGAFVSLGNKADLSSNDLLEYWEEDEATGVIALYLESFGNPRRFARIARRVAGRKAIVAVKGGRSEAGRRAAASHTAALASADVAVDALFRQAGVVRCDTLAELFDVVALLASQPVPAGNRVGAVTNAGGLGILCADACEASGLALPSLGEATRAALGALLPAEAALANPVDMIASAGAATFGQALRHVLADPGVDAAIALFVPTAFTDPADIAAAIAAACSPPPPKPVLAVFVGPTGAGDVLRRAAAIPAYSFPEAAARALGQAAAYGTWLRRPAGSIPALATIDPEAARPIVARALAREASPWLLPDEIAGLLGAFGIAPTEAVIARSAEEAAEACRRLGPPVAVKLVSRRVLHKTDVGGVHLDVRSPEATAAAYRAISEALAATGQAEAMDGALVQPMVSGVVECLVGVVVDPLFGPLIAFGLGGITAEAIGDIAFRLHPLTDVDAEELIGSIRATKLLHGFRGRPPADVAALRDLLLRVSRLVEEVPEVAELDLNPVMVRAEGQGALVLDARLRLSASG
ncbi:MAG: GNAT family N-acetyltransferase [Chloroflexi bacterium]|nr:GNAT family N-acetyltransferase [Chloroflexota bacterium]